MTPTTKRLMKNITARMDRYVDREMSACGHEEPALHAAMLRAKLLGYIETEIEGLVLKVEGLNGQLENMKRIAEPRILACAAAVSAKEGA